MKILIGLFFLFPFICSSELRIDITQGNMDPIPLAVLKFNTADNESKEISSNINSVISGNLQKSGLFSILPQKLFLIYQFLLIRNRSSLIGRLQQPKVWFMES